VSAVICTAAISQGESSVSYFMLDFLKNATYGVKTSKLAVSPPYMGSLRKSSYGIEGNIMTENRQNNELSVDRREETVVTQQPGYAATERVTRDVAAEHRLQLFQIVRIVWTILGLLEILLGLRFVLKLIAANAASGFGALIYGVSGVFVAPFAGLITTPVSGGTILEITTLIAMAVYALFFWLVVRGIAIVADRPSARSVSRSVHEVSADGSNSTTSTTHKS
jgi:YggT family protein